MNGYLLSIDTMDDKTAATVRERHTRQFRAAEAALDHVLRGLSDFASRKGKPDNRLESASLFLATRSYNSLRTALQVLERGYYQQAMALVRMAQEDQLIALDAENYPKTLSALLDGDGKLGRGDLALTEMAKRVSPMVKDAWDHDYGALSMYGAHPRVGSLQGLVTVGTGEHLVLRSGGHYDEMWVNIVLYFMLRELGQVLAIVEAVTASAGVDWATGAMPTFKEIDSLWRQIDEWFGEQLDESAS